MSERSSDPPDAGTANGGNGDKNPRPWWKRPAYWVFGVLAILTVAGAAGAWKVDHIAKDPQFCQNCHLGAVNENHASVHEGQTCTACHQSRYEQNVRQWAMSLYSSTKTTPHGKFEPKSCESCHTKGSTEAWHITRTNGHRDHVLKAEKPLDCSECHSWKAHKTEPKPDACAKCHTEISVYGEHRLEGKKEKISCLSCHNYLAKVGGGAQTPSHDCRRCHGGVKSDARSNRYATVVKAKAVPATMIHGSLKTCSLCHTPHEKTEAKRTPGNVCTRCHVKIPSEFHEKQRPEEFNCDTCHSAHSPRKKLMTVCTTCHKDKAEQKKTLASNHDRCAQCHKPHEFTASLEGCRKCHEDQTTMLASWKSEKHSTCTNCHKPHSTKKEQTTCVTCHRKNAGHKHKECTTCHDPHQSKKDTKRCSTCHKPQSNQLARAVAPHRRANCATCHSPHAPTLAPKACAKCHTKEYQLVATARIDKHENCASCHQTHAFRASFDACTSCHKNPASGPHTGKCSTCHVPHGPPKGKAASCRSCHKDISQPAGKHSQCQTCHKAPHGDKLKSAPCATCHGDKATNVLAWPAKTHASCKQCHQTHNPARPKQCAQCHASQAQAVQKTRHQCSSCHDAHQPPKNLWGACNKCHSTQVSAVRTRGPKHSTCNSCHKPHDVTPPACTKCHTSLQAAHKVKGHDRCNSCHDTHAKKSPTRKDCLRCHQDKQSHFPNAQNCAACHLFRKAK